MGVIGYVSAGTIKTEVKVDGTLWRRLGVLAEVTGRDVDFLVGFAVSELLMSRAAHNPALADRVAAVEGPEVVAVLGGLPDTARQTAQVGDAILHRCDGENEEAFT